MRDSGRMEGVVSQLVDKLAQMRASCRFVVKPTLALFVIYLVAYSAIIMANFNYIDDMGRVAQGYDRWGSSFSRYTSDILSHFLHTGTYLTDVSPLTQIIASLELALAGVVVLYVVTGKKAYSLLMLVSVLPLGLSPYFLECISYKFDSPYMALSVLASVVPLLLAEKNKVAYGLAVVAGEIIVCTTYQAATGILPMLVVMLACLQWCRGASAKQVGGFLARSAVAFGVGILVFKFFIMQPVDSYVSNSLPSLTEFAPTVIANFKTYLKLVLTDFRRSWLILCVLVVAAFLIVMMLNAKRGKLPGFLAGLACILLMGCLVFGMYPALSDPLFAPRAMYGVGAFFAFLGAVVASSDRAVVGKFIVVALCWCFFVFAFTYGNALTVQAQWTDFRITSVVNDLGDLEQFSDDGEKTVQIEGNIGYAPTLRNQPQGYQMLNRLVPITFRQDWSWGVAGMKFYYGIKNATITYEGDFSELNMPLLKRSMYHDIYGEGDKYLVVLK